jgi:hypothetical protein
MKLEEKVKIHWAVTVPMLAGLPTKGTIDLAQEDGPFFIWIKDLNGKTYQINPQHVAALEYLEC